MSHPHGAIPDPRLILNQMEIPEYPGIFVLGTYEKNVSILAQQIRAINLVLSLESEERLLKNHSVSTGRDRKNREYKDVVVIGNGVAGKTAAAMFSQCHCNVTVVGQDNDDSNVNPAHSSRRFIHPFISDFPFAELPKKDPDSAALPVMDWRAGDAHKVYNTFHGLWEGILKPKTKPSTDFGRVTLSIARADEILTTTGGRYVVLLDSTEMLNADIVILAVGIGDLQKTNNYWDGHTQSLQEQPVRGTLWLLSGMGDSNITEFITLVCSASEQQSAYERLISHLVAYFQQDKSNALLGECRDLEHVCQYMRPEQASEHLETEYKRLLDKFDKDSSFKGTLETIAAGVRDSSTLPGVILNSTTPKPYSRDTFPLNRLALAIVIRALRENYGDGQLVSYVSGKATHDSDGIQPTTPQEVVGRAASVIEIGNKWLMCNHFNPRRAPASSLRTLLLDKQPVDARAREELKPRNGLDQTRHRMWPYHGNLKRILSFRPPVRVAAALKSECPDGVVNPLVVTMTFKAASVELNIEMCYVPAFRGVSDDVRLFPGYWISRYPIMRAQWAEGMGADGQENVPAKKNVQSTDVKLPVTNTSWLQALDFCMKYGISLPTEVQWRAAWQWPCEPRSKPRDFPWGDFGRDWGQSGKREGGTSPFVVSNLHDKKRAASYGGRYGVCQVNSHRDADGPWGTSQQYGNILEWCLNGGRPLEHYFKTESDTAIAIPTEGVVRAARLRPLGGVSALETDESVMEQWPRFTWAHDETKRPDVGFRVVWTGSLSEVDEDSKQIAQRARELDSLGANEKPDRDSSVALLALESQLAISVEKMKGKVATGKSVPSFGELARRLKANEIRQVVIVLGTANQSSQSGHRMEQALAYDALGLDLLIAWFKESHDIDAEIELAQTNKKEWQCKRKELMILVGSGRTNPATHGCLEKLREVKRLPGISFLHPEGNVLCDGNRASYKPELGMLAVVSCPHGGDGFVVISAGVGREGTAAANYALARILGKRNGSMQVGGLQSVRRANCSSVVVLAERDGDRITKVDIHKDIPKRFMVISPKVRPEKVPPA